MSLREEKVTKIFSRFDANCDGYLNRAEMSALVIAANPRVPFNEEQIAAILDEVFRTYDDYIEGDKGLSFEGLLQTYYDGAGDVDRDFKALGLEMDTETEVSGIEGRLAIVNEQPTVLGDGRPHSSRKRHVGSWAGSPNNGIVYDDTWCLVEDLVSFIRKIEQKMDARTKKTKDAPCALDSCTASVGWIRNAGSVDDSPISEVPITQRKWEDLGQDYANFQHEVSQIRKNADGSSTQEQAFDAHMAIGRTLFDHRLYKEALMSFKRANELKPTDVRSHFHLGNTLYALRRILEAQEVYTSALDLGEWNNLIPQIHVNLGIALEAEGMLLCACEHYKEAAIHEPKHYRALKLLGSASLGVGEYKAAKEALQEAIYLYPDYADAHCDLGSVLHALGDHEQAVKEFQTVINLKPGHVEALYNLGTLLKDMGLYTRAAATYAKVLVLQPNNWRAQLNRAVSLLGGGLIEEAKKALREAYRMTLRYELHDALVYLRHMEKRPKGLSSFLRRGEENAGVIGDNFRAEDNFVVVEPSYFQRANERTTPRQLLAFALEIRNFQKYTRLNRCCIDAVKRELGRTLIPVPSSQIGILEKTVRKEEVERILRRLLHSVRPEVFQGAMKMVNEKALSVLDMGGSGRIDIGMFFAVLAPLSGGSVNKRKHTAFDALVFRSSKNVDGEITKADAKCYFKALRAAYMPGLVTSSLIQRKGGIDVNDHARLSFPEFDEMFDDPDVGFGVLSIVVKLESEDQVRHGKQSCSVCCYPVIGPLFKEVRSNFSLCSSCYSSGKVPATVKQEEYYFKEYNGGLDAVKGKLQNFKTSLSSCMEM